MDSLSVSDLGPASTSVSDLGESSTSVSCEWSDLNLDVSSRPSLSDVSALADVASDPPANASAIVSGITLSALASIDSAGTGAADATGKEQKERGNDNGDEAVHRCAGDQVAMETAGDECASASRVDADADADANADTGPNSDAATADAAAAVMESQGGVESARSPEKMKMHVNAFLSTTDIDRSFDESEQLLHATAHSNCAAAEETLYDVDMDGATATNGGLELENKEEAIGDGKENGEKEKKECALIGEDERQGREDATAIANSTVTATGIAAGTATATATERGETASQQTQPKTTFLIESRFPLNTFVFAAYSFERRRSSQLSFTKGDILQITRYLNEDWAKATLVNQGDPATRDMGPSSADPEGYIPINYVEVLDKREQVIQHARQRSRTLSIDSSCSTAGPSGTGESRTLVGLYDFTAQRSEQLSFRKNEIMLVVGVLNKDWLKAEHTTTKQQGYVPINYVKFVDTI